MCKGPAPDRWETFYCCLPITCIILFAVGFYLTPWVEVAFAGLQIVALMVLIWVAHDGKHVRTEALVVALSIAFCAALLLHASSRLCCVDEQSNAASLMMAATRAI